MKSSFWVLLSMMSMLLSGAVLSCNKESKVGNVENLDAMAGGKIKISVNAQSFTATLLDNSSTSAFKKMLPFTVNMTELSGNEKYFEFPNNLPTNASIPEIIKIGDIMLYGPRTLVLFYKSFSTSYSYTKLGTVDDVRGLATALGSGNAIITCSEMYSQ